MMAYLRTKKRKPYRKHPDPVKADNDQFMVNVGLRPPHLKIDKSIFQKTDKEKQLLREMKKSCY